MIFTDIIVVIFIIVSFKPTVSVLKKPKCFLVMKKQLHKDKNNLIKLTVKIYFIYFVVATLYSKKLFGIFKAFVL